MHNPLTKEQMKKVDELYRNRSWSIKKIAKELRISDRRVSAFLRGDMKGEKEKKESNGNKDFFQAAVKESVKEYERNCEHLTKVLYITILEEVKDTLGHKSWSKAELNNVVDKRLGRLFNAIVDATTMAVCEVMFTMPRKLKVLWAKSLDREPNDFLHAKQKKQALKK